MIEYRIQGARPGSLPARFESRIARACAGVRGLPRTRAIIGLRFVGEREIQRLNRAFRGKNKPTDVLSFALDASRAFPIGEKKEQELGDLVICSTMAAKEARRRSMEVTEELVRLIIHGTLHLAGMDHANLEDEARMFALQERLVERVIS